MTFSQTKSGGFISDFVKHTDSDLKSLLNKFNIKSLGHGRLYIYRKDTKAQFFVSVFLNGLEHALDGNLITSDGTINEIHTMTNPDRKAFLYEYFEEYNPIDSLDFEDAVDFLMGDYASLDQNKINDMCLVGGNKLYNFLDNKFELIMETIFTNPLYSAFAQYIQNLDESDNWYYRTLKQGKSFIRMSIDNPLGGDNIADNLRKILTTGEDGTISLTSDTGLYKAVSSNTLLQQLKIPISYDDLVNFLSYDNLGTTANDVMYRLFMTYDVHTAKMNPTYTINPRVYLKSHEEVIRNQAVDAYQEIISMFDEEVIGSYYYGDTSIKFYTDYGGGVSNHLIKNRLKKYGMVKSRIDFNTLDLADLRNAIASMVFYSYLLPDVFVNIKNKQKHILFADPFSLHTPEYIFDTILANPISGTFIWDLNQGGLTRENYNTRMNSFNGFSHEIIRNFFQERDFESNFKVLLEIFNKWFQNEIHSDINIVNLFEF